MVWQFAAGPRKSVPLNATFNPHDRTRQRVLNYSAIFDEVEDFEINIRNVSGPGNLAAPINGNALVNGVNVLAAEVHQAATNSSDLGFNLDLTGNYAGALPPVITVASPTNTTPYNPAGVPLLVNARDPEGTVTNVDFYVEGQFARRAASAPFSGLWTNVALGTHTVQAVATDNTGLSASSPIASFHIVLTGVTTLVNSNATWKYLDDGSNQGVLWRTNNYNDAGWSNGVAELGYGDGPALPEATVIRSTGTNGARIITTYFRKTFTVDSPAYYSNLVVRLRRDDGGVVYLNGVEVFRSNMTNDPGNLVLFSDFAGNNTGSEIAFNITNLNPSVLVAGQNLVAVEVHQQNLTSSDVSFDLQLQGESGPLLLFINRSASLVTLNWLPALPGLQLQHAPTPSGPWTAAPNQANPQSFTVNPLDLPVFWRLRAP